jgi:Tfp pilus assembly protein PilN
MSDRDDFHERFLKLNATPDSLKIYFSNFMRRALRASLNPHGYFSPVNEAAGELEIFLKLLARCEEPISSRELILAFAESMKLPDPKNELQRSLQEVIEDAQKYALEATSDDNAAAGRASKQHSGLIQSIESFHELWRKARKY